MKCAFVCWRPYQVFNAVNIIMNNLEGTKGNSDIFIQKIPSLEAIMGRLIESNLFDNVYCFNEKNRGDGTEVTKWTMLKIRSQKTVDFLFPKRALKRNCLYEDIRMDCYDIILSSGWISFNTELININPKAKVIMFEDGFGNYIEDDLEMLPASQKVYFDLMNRFFHKGLFSFSVESRYLYKPELVTSDIKTKIKELPQLTDTVFKTLCYIFDFCSDNKYKNNRIIYLDQPLKNVTSPSSVEDVLEILSAIKSFVYRRHPLQIRSKMKELEDSDMPMWELVSAQFTKNTILISPYSTALLTPYLIYGIKPGMIFTYKMFLSEDSTKCLSVDKFINQLESVYDNRIYTPKTIEEFRSTIQELASI